MRARTWESTALDAVALSHILRVRLVAVLLSPCGLNIIILVSLLKIIFYFLKKIGLHI